MSDINLAYNAIIEQLTGNIYGITFEEEQEDEETEDEETEDECLICYTDTPFANMYTFMCNHKFCISCATKLCLTLFPKCALCRTIIDNRHREIILYRHIPDVISYRDVKIGCVYVSRVWSQPSEYQTSRSFSFSRW
jgi:hypothetical protein